MKMPNGRGNGNFVWDTKNAKMVKISDWSTVNTPSSMDPLSPDKISSHSYNNNVGVLIFYTNDQKSVQVAKLTT